MSELTPRIISIIPWAYGESIRRAISSAAFKRAATRCGRPTPSAQRWPASIARARAIRERLAGPQRQQQPARLKIRARIGSLIVSPATADQQRSIRVKSIAEIWLSSRLTKLRPPSLSNVRCHRSDSCGLRVVSGIDMPSGPSRVRNSARPFSTWPLIKSWVEASRFNSRVSAAVADSAAFK